MWVVLGDDWCERVFNRRELDVDISEREFALSARLRQQSGREVQKVNEAAEQLAPHNRFFQRMQRRSLPRRRRATCCTANVVFNEDKPGSCYAAADKTELLYNEKPCRSREVYVSKI